MDDIRGRERFLVAYFVIRVKVLAVSFRFIHPKKLSKGDRWQLRLSLTWTPTCLTSFKLSKVYFHCHYYCCCWLILVIDENLPTEPSIFLSDGWSPWNAEFLSLWIIGGWICGCGQTWKDQSVRVKLMVYTTRTRATHWFSRNSITPKKVDRHRLGNWWKC